MLLCGLILSIPVLWVTYKALGYESYRAEYITSDLTTGRKMVMRVVHHWNGKEKTRKTVFRGSWAECQNFMDRSSLIP